MPGPRRREYRERFQELSAEDQEQQRRLLRLFLRFLQDGVSCPAEEMAEEPEEDAAGDDLDLDVWGAAFGDDD